jgi:cellulose biosynthesis protein BcsQ
MLIAVCCDRGAPGATTTALALGVASAEPTVVVEADQYGGDLALRCTPASGGSFLPTPTVLTLATEARSSTDPGLVASRAQEFAGATRVVPGHISAEQASGVRSWAPLARALTASASRVVVDLGRIHSASPTLPIAAAADLVVVVARPEMGSVLHLRDRLERMAPVLANVRNAPPVVVPVLVTAKRFAASVVAQVRELLATSNANQVVADVGWIAWDPESVTRLHVGGPRGRDSRTPLLRSAARVNEQLARLLAGADPAADRPVALRAAR